VQDGSKGGFTLIELSIVLVVIGLIVGSILAGQSLINAATVRAQITQIERINTAANTFRVKYGYLPGDIKDPDASSFGFQSRGIYEGEGDGNGLIEGIQVNYLGSYNSFFEGAGETGMFWVDLSTAHLIDGGFSSASATASSGLNLTPSSNPSLGAFFPPAKMGSGQYILVFSSNGVNYYGVVGISSVTTLNAALTYTQSTPAQAYAIDAKIDDGLPQSGTVTARYLYFYSFVYAVGGGGAGAGQYGTQNPIATAGSSTTCYDNGNVYQAIMKYSTSQPTNNLNCALSYKMQAGD
jgi:prepilin-type N-terminal cleavage/methylation domain-containing protein